MSQPDKTLRSRALPARMAGPALVLAGTVVLTLLGLGSQKAPGQEASRGNGRPGKTAQEWTVESHDRTNFPLVGRHRSLNCRECHVNLVFEGTPADCEACHWQRRQDDRYGLRLGPRCAECHTPHSWKRIDPAKWSHETAAGFRLEGVHRTLDCEACHGSGGFEPRPTDCYACHEADYRGAEEPDHAAVGFSIDCAGCHGQRSWESASFAHASFPLQGRHASAACTDCHANGVYAGTSPDCAFCHIDDYNGTADPSHRSAGFPVDCVQCHGTAAEGWSGANFAHEFPIRSGRHSGLSCTECHKSSDYRVFTCLECHAHDRTDMDERHRGVTGYAYSSQACTACHPQGQG